MTKLEEDLYAALLSREGVKRSDAAYYPMTASVCSGQAKSAAEVAKRYIEKAFHNGQSSVNTRYGEYEQNFEEWANENGIV